MGVKNLSLNQALCGFKTKLKHLDGREILIQSLPGEIIQPENGTQPFVKIVPEEGMPSRGNPFVKGNLYVLFRINFPEDGSLSDETRKILKETLPDPDMEVEYDENEVEFCTLKHADGKISVRVVHIMLVIRSMIVMKMKVVNQ